MEKRLPIAVVVRMGHAQNGVAGAQELTYTDNVSAHGARVISSQFWERGTGVVLTSLKDDAKIHGKVAYCEKLSNCRYGIGLSFQDNGGTSGLGRICNSWLEPFRQTSLGGTRGARSR